MMNRNIYLTERPDEHLVWHRTRILLKPLPEYLLYHSFWFENLHDEDALHKSAVGLLLSYSWLVVHQSDFALAKHAGLILPAVGWRAWTVFVADFLNNIDTDTLAQVDSRYQYGELRLSRLNSMTRYRPIVGLHSNFFGQYIATSTWHQDFFDRNFSWLLVISIYTCVVLSAMHAGLATLQLGKDVRSQNMSYGVALLSIAAVLASIASIGTVWFVLFWCHFMSTISFTRRTLSGRKAKTSMFA